MEEAEALDGGEINVTDESNEEAVAESFEDGSHKEEDTRFEVVFDARVEHASENPLEQPTQGDEDSEQVDTVTEVLDPAYTSNETHEGETTEAVDDIHTIGDNSIKSPLEDVDKQGNLEEEMGSPSSKGDVLIEMSNQTESAILDTAPDNPDSGRSINLTTEPEPELRGHGLADEWQKTHTPTPALSVENEDTLQTKDVSPCILVFILPFSAFISLLIHEFTADTFL